MKEVTDLLCQHWGKKSHHDHSNMQQHKLQDRVLQGAPMILHSDKRAVHQEEKITLNIRVFSARYTWVLSDFIKQNWQYLDVFTFLLVINGLIKIDKEKVWSMLWANIIYWVVTEHMQNLRMHVYESSAWESLGRHSWIIKKSTNIKQLKSSECVLCSICHLMSY